jgi:sugar phosphate isomerase/epimerase
MLLLIPLLSGLADRMEALKDVADPAVRAALDAVAAWIEAGAPREPGLALVERLQDLAAAAATPTGRAC